MRLSKLIQMVREKWIWDTERYPGLPKVEQRECLDGGDALSRFQRKHVLLHMMKQTGRLAETEEQCDHDPSNGFVPRYLERREQVAKLLVSLLHLAAIEQISEDDLVTEMKKVLKDSNRLPDFVNDDVE